MTNFNAISCTSRELISALTGEHSSEAHAEILRRMDRTEKAKQPTAAKVRAFNAFAEALGVPERLEYVRKDGSVLSFDKTSPKVSKPKAQPKPKASKAPAKAQSPKPKASAKSSTSARLDALESQMAQVLTLLQAMAKQ